MNINDWIQKSIDDKSHTETAIHALFSLCDEYKKNEYLDDFVLNSLYSMTEGNKLASLLYSIEDFYQYEFVSEFIDENDNTYNFGWTSFKGSHDNDIDNKAEFINLFEHSDDFRRWQDDIFKQDWDNSDIPISSAARAIIESAWVKDSSVSEDVNKLMKSLASKIEPGLLSNLLDSHITMDEAFNNYSKKLCLLSINSHPLSVSIDSDIQIELAAIAHNLVHGQNPQLDTQKDAIQHVLDNHLNDNEYGLFETTSTPNKN
jgi:hypothetical protein